MSERERYWQFCQGDEDITSSPTAELDATEKRLWETDDGPTEVWTREPLDMARGYVLEWSEWKRVE